jgi:prepilin-type N-terminal cleavage/methylation domain-containing protein/prepilin-type processing-associated H-X9-DG protein
MTRPARRGFTLIELLVVVAVLTILAGLLLPVLALARDAACRSRCLSTLHQLALAHQAYVQDYDEVLPFWTVDSPSGARPWTEFLRPYYREPSLLDQGFTAPDTRRASGWLADYALCTWGPGGKGTRESPYWRWPGAPAGDPATPAPMRLAEVQRPAESMQWIDGLTTTAGCTLFSFHPNGARNGAFLDGHARPISATDWNRVCQDDSGAFFFYWIASADR